MIKTRAQRTRPLRLVLLGLVLLAALPALAEDDRLVVRGTVNDQGGGSLEGYRVVVRLAGDSQVFLSAPTQANGEYAVALPAGARCEIVAIISPGGLRIAVEPRLQVQATRGARRNVVVDLSAVANGERSPRRFPGSDRLFLSFVEDTAMVDRYRWEATLELSDSSAGDLRVSRALAAFQLGDLPRVEFGARMGLAGLDGARGVPDAAGPTDLDLWAKLFVGPRWSPHAEFSVGTLVTLPTGDEATGTSFDALRSKLFGSMRYHLPRFTLSAHAGLRFNEDSDLGRFGLDGRTAPALGVGILAPLRDTLTVVGEAVYEGERFDGGEADARLLAGVNWRPLPYGVVRIALAGGLTDGAPDSQLLLGFSIDF